MTDKELLELADKAAGIEYNTKHDALGLALAGNIKSRLWNPLDDDGDALRLAVKLNIFVCVRKDGFINAGTDEIMFLYRFSDDPCADTRRAIVKVAAAIGKNVP